MLNSRFISENEKLFFALRDLLGRVEDITDRYEKLKTGYQSQLSYIEKINKTISENKDYIDRLESEKNLNSDEVVKLKKSVLEKDEINVNLSDEIRRLEETNKSLQVKLASRDEDIEKLKNFYEEEITKQTEIIREKDRLSEELSIKYESKVNILITENQNIEQKLKNLESLYQESKNLKSERELSLTDEVKLSGPTEADRTELKEKIDKVIEKIDEIIS